MHEANFRTILKAEISRLKDGTPAPENIPDDLLLFDVNEDGAENLGLDSLDALELALTIEEKLGLHLPSDLDFKQAPTIDRLVAYVVRLSAE